MAVFRDAEQMQVLLRATLERVQTTPVAQGVRDVGLIIGFIYKEPDLTMLVDGRSEPPPGQVFTVRFNDLNPAPDVCFEQSARIGHQFWRGQLNVPMAMMRGQVKATGDISRALKFLPLLPPLYEAYNAVLAESGEAELLK